MKIQQVVAIGFQVCALLIALVRPEESSIMDGCTMLTRDLVAANTFSANAICDGGFKSYAITSAADVGGGNKEIVSVLSAAKTAKTAFVQNYGVGDYQKKRMGTSALYFGVDTGPFSAGMTKCSADFFDSGFYPITCSVAGKNAAIRRTGTSASDNSYHVQEVRLYQTKNLLELQGVTISAPPPTSPAYEATNLITNFSSRTPTGSLGPHTNWAGNTATWNSCFQTGESQLSAHGNKLILQIDLKATYFIHAILAVQDLFNGWSVADMNDEFKFFQNYEIHVGNQANHAQNPKCPGGPFMVVGDPKSYIKVEYTGSGGKLDMWKFGNEVWCNMEGRYLTIVADLSHLAGRLSPIDRNPYLMSLCHLGVFRAMYKRTTPVPPSQSVTIGTPITLSIEKITARSSTPISNTLDIMLRQKAGTELSWVTFTQDTLVTKQTQHLTEALLRASTTSFLSLLTEPAVSIRP